MYTGARFIMSLGAEPLGGLPDSSSNNFRLDSTAKKTSIIYRVEKDMVFDQVQLPFLNLTGTPTYLVSIQGVDGTGIPNGVTAESTQFDPSANGLQAITLDGEVTVSVNDLISITLEDHPSAGTNPDASNYIDLVRAGIRVVYLGPPYVADDTGAGYVKQNQHMGLFGLRNSGDTTDVQGMPVESLQVSSGNVISSVGNRLGQKFQIPAFWGNRIQVAGIVLQMWTSTTFKAGFWSDSAAIVVTDTIDPDICYGGSSSYRMETQTFAPTWLDTGVDYYGGVEQVGAGAIILGGHDCVTDDNLSAFPGYPNNNICSFNGATWSSVTGIMSTELGLLVTDFDGKVNASSIFQNIYHPCLK